ncbi:MAG: cysteine--tRNA ligase [Trichodesmium sp. MAG_R03]|nr:cysteine--tRNA ligase [Trichodesmium sp. MAG_R03]
MTLKLYNSLTSQEEKFESLEPDKIKMYICGVTVYDYCHLGHARSYIVWDTIRRYLMWRGYQVQYVQNFTDIDDKIINRARETESSMESVVERFIEAYFEDMKRLNVLEADEYPRATHKIDAIKRLIHDLEKRGFAYSSGGDVYYQVREFSEYGKLSGRCVEEMQAGASGRVESEDLEAAKKKNPFDFALWKAAKVGEPAWNSPWGKGRPGWHIECSAMVKDCLGETIDIHGGGADLIFPHHENEIAQSEASTGKSLARYWLHNGFVTINGEKMSKSLGNFTTIRDLLNRPIDPMAVRMFVLTAQYRKPIDFTEEAIASAKNGWNTIKEGLLFAYQYGSQLGWEMPEKTLSEETKLLTFQVEKFQKAMDDDINTPAALAVLFELAKELRREGNFLVHEGKTKTSLEKLQKQWVTLVNLSQVLGLEVKIDEQVSSISGDLSDAEIDSLIQQRLEAKKAKNYSEADRIRNELQNEGIKLIDKPDGITNWHRN